MLASVKKLKRNTVTQDVGNQVPVTQGLRTSMDFFKHLKICAIHIKSGY